MLAAGDQAFAVTNGGSLDIALRVGAGLALLHLRNADGVRRLPAFAARIAAAEADRLARVLARTAWDRATDGIRPDGSMTIATSLQLLSLAYGARISGVPLPAGARGAPGVSGTTIMQRVLDAWPRLSAVQQDDVQRALHVSTIPAALVAMEGRGARSRAAVACALVDPRFPVDVAATADATRLRDEIGGRLGASHAWQICVFDVPGGGSVFADTLWSDGRALRDPHDLPLPAAAAMNECYMRAFEGMRRLSAADRLTVLAHEAYHCVHFEQRATLALGGGSAGPENPQWIEDGLATWVGNKVAQGTYLPTSDPPGNYYSAYLRKPWTSWFSYTYEAFGLLGEVEAKAGEGQIWQAIPKIWAAGPASSVIFHDVVGSAEGTVLDDAGADLLRLARVPDWHQKLPFDVSGESSGTPSPVRLLTGTPTAGGGEVGAHRAGIYEIVAGEYPLVDVDINGYGKLTDGKTTWPRPRGRWLCLGGGCACPSGQKQIKEIPDHVDVAAGAHVYAGLAGGDAGSLIVVDGHAMDEYCEAGKLKGIWSGSWASTKYPIQGTFQMQLTQTGGGFEGTISIAGSACVSGGTVTGAVTGKRVTFGVVQSRGKTVTYTGILTKSGMAGAFASPSCGGDAGNWTATKR